MVNFEYWLGCTVTGNLVLATLITSILATFLIAIV